MKFVKIDKEEVVPPNEDSTERKGGYKLFAFVMAAFVLVQVVSNIAAVKTVQLGPFLFDAGTLLFPISYIFGDVLGEVYGYKRSKVIIWAGMTASVLMALYLALVGWLPAADGWGMQTEYMKILGQTPRIVLGSAAGFFCGSISNAVILARMKIWTNGRYLWMRTIGSTVVGEFLDSLVFVVIAFAGTMTWPVLWTIIFSNYIFKTAYEAVATPITYRVCSWLKRVESEDYYDRTTRWNPLSVHTDDVLRDQ